jgi:hypothetical protein
MSPYAMYRGTGRGNSPDITRLHWPSDGRVLYILTFEASALQLTVVTIRGSCKVTRPCNVTTPSRLLRLTASCTMVQRTLREQVTA